MWRRCLCFAWKFILLVTGFGQCIFMLLGSAKQMNGPYSWMTYDAFDEIDDRMNAINAQNCRLKAAAELRLPADTVAQAPKFPHLLNYTVYPNRSALLHIHNMALNRAFYYSYIFQMLSEVEHYFDQPGLLYYYFSTAADVSANMNNINGSGVFFDYKTAYAVWYWFNITLPLFGPRAWRSGDFNELASWIREEASHTVNIVDYAAEPERSDKDRDYSHYWSKPRNSYNSKNYKINQWYDLFLPDDWSKKGLDTVRKFIYDIKIKYSDETGKFTKDDYETKSLFGPPFPSRLDAEYLPVLFTEPYFDCGRSNRWIVSAVAPVVSFVPRYCRWGPCSFRRKTYIAVTTVDMDFLSIDFNPCPASIGNQLPNYFQNISRCKSTTVCEPLYGWGFRRGGYQCLCKPGYRYPPWQQGPFQGIEIESATEAEFINGFDCFPIGLHQVIPKKVSTETHGICSERFNFACRKKRSSDSEEELIDHDFGFFDRPLIARKTDRAARSVKADVLQSRILNKKLRLLRMANLKEQKIVVKTKNGKERKKLAVIPRVSHPFHMNLKTNRKVQFVPRHRSDTGHKKTKRESFDPKLHDLVKSILSRKASVNKDNCNSYKPEELWLSGDVAYNVDVLFSNQARTALRLSHFLCNFLQNLNKYEWYGKWRRDRPLNVEQIFGEVLANVMGDLRIKGSGVFFDIDKFNGSDGKTRQFFAPYAWRYEETDDGQDTDRHGISTQIRAVDYAGFPTSYLEELWFKNVKDQWRSNTYSLGRFTENMVVRSEINPMSPPERLFPLSYKAPREEDGLWTGPYFDCDGYVDDWIVTYSVPFFGQNSISTGVEFKGVVIVDIKLDELDINQCPQDYSVSNAFKSTARCHYETTNCVHLAGSKFVLGSYKCECKTGYEYPFSDGALHFDGKKIEEEYRLKMAGDTKNRYDILQCRISVASSTAVNILITLTAVFWSLTA